VRSNAKAPDRCNYEEIEKLFREKKEPRIRKKGGERERREAKRNKGKKATRPSKLFASGEV